MNTSDTGDTDKIKVILMQTAYKFYTIKAMSCDVNNPQSFMLSTNARATWEDPLLTIHNALQNKSIDGYISYTVSQLLHTIAKHDSKLFTSLRREYNRTTTKELITQLKIIYYSIAFDDEFRNAVFIMFDCSYLDKHIVSLQKAGARITHGIMSYPGNSCIECNKKLVILFKKNRTDAKGSIETIYNKKAAPKICNSYQKYCENCKIYYNHNRIDYHDTSPHKAKQNQTIFLDPDAFPYYSIAGRAAKNYIHQSIYKSIESHQYCNKSTSIDVWLQHFNEDWSAECDELSKIPNICSFISSIKLGYNTLRRYFYFYSLLRRIRDVENYQTININGRAIKIALIISNADKKGMINDLNFLDTAKNNSPNKNTNSKKKAQKLRASHHYFRYFVNKYYQQLITSEVAALKKVPVKKNDESGEIEIYPGWFIVYGDGAEKITRLRCAYPAILAKLDYMMEMINDEECKINEIEMDNDDIDLTINHNSSLYSTQRYYECANSPCFNDPDNDKKSYKCCKHHVAKLVEHGIQLMDITDFITWYQLHAALARMKNTKVQETIKATYTITEEALKSIDTKHNKKILQLEHKIAKFTENKKDQHVKFEEIVDNIFDKINRLRRNSRAHLGREAKDRGNAEAIVDNNEDKKQAFIDKLRNILGDDDFDANVIDNMEMPVLDLLDLEFNNDTYLDKYKGCRKAKYISKATTARTKGLNGLFNTAGVMIKLSEEIVRETPTAVLLEVADACTNNPTSIKYANRIEAIGYDMMCRIYHHLKKLIENKRLSSIQAQFWCDLINRAFIDIWHIYTHTDVLCKEDGIFHPKLKKFKCILYNINELMERVNDQIAEQFWSTMNATSQLKAMTKETFTIFLLDKRSYYNQAKINKIKQDGWTFIPIEWCTSLRNVESGLAASATLPSEQDLKSSNKTPLQKIQIKPNKLNDVKAMINNNNTAVIGIRRQLNDAQHDDNPNKRRRIN